MLWSIENNQTYFYIFSTVNKIAQNSVINLFDTNLVIQFLCLLFNKIF
jgi:hypothetical protein